MEIEKDVIDEAIDRTFSRSKIDGPFHDAEKEIASMNEDIELAINRISMCTDEMSFEELNKIMGMLMDSLVGFTDKVRAIRELHPWDK